jgi:flagellar export protein FliJ
MDARLLRQLLDHRKACEQRLARECEAARRDHQRALSAQTQLRAFAFEYRDVAQAAARAPASAGYLRDAHDFGTRLDQAGQAQAQGVADHARRAEAAASRLLGAWRQREVIGRVFERVCRSDARAAASQAMDEVEDQVSSRWDQQAGTNGAERGS